VHVSQVQSLIPVILSPSLCSADFALALKLQEEEDRMRAEALAQVPQAAVPPPRSRSPAGSQVCRGKEWCHTVMIL
jgi:hypothetical protein